MFKKEFLETVKQNVIGKNYSRTDLYIVFNEILEASYQWGSITANQRDRWFLTDREYVTLRKYTKLQCVCK